MGLFKKDKKIQKEKKIDIVHCPECGHYYNPYEHEACPKCSKVEIPVTVDKEKVSQRKSLKGEHMFSADGEKEIKRVDKLEDGTKTIGWANLQGRDLKQFVSLEVGDEVISAQKKPEESVSAVRLPNTAEIDPRIISPKEWHQKQQTEVDDEPVTVGVFGGRQYIKAVNEKKTDTEDTVDGESEDSFIPAEPVVGWLVCIKGCNRGRSYELKSGFNYVGRSKNMDVALIGDTQVSREKHISIIHDYKKNRFLVSMGDTSKQSVYVNGEILLTNPVELQVYDVLEIGSSELMFVPFCGEHFNWTK